VPLQVGSFGSRLLRARRVQRETAGGDQRQRNRHDFRRRLSLSSFKSRQLLSCRQLRPNLTRPRSPSAIRETTDDALARRAIRHTTFELP
jgi:hypothetical protein